MGVSPEDLRRLVEGHAAFVAAGGRGPGALPVRAGPAARALRRARRPDARDGVGHRRRPTRHRAAPAQAARHLDAARRPHRRRREPGRGGPARGDRGAGPRGRASRHRAAADPSRRPRGGATGTRISTCATSCWGRTRTRCPRPTRAPMRAGAAGTRRWPWPTPRSPTRCRWPGPPTRRWRDRRPRRTCWPSRTSTPPSPSSSTGAPGAASSRRASPRSRRSWRELEAERADAAARRAVLTATQKELEEQIAGISERRSVIETRMYAATSSSGRDLQAMNDEVRHLTDRRAELEELGAGGHARPGPRRRRAGRRCASAPRRSRRRPRSCACSGRGPGRDRCRAGRGGRRPGGRGGALARPRSPTATRRCGPASRAPGRARLVGSHCDGCHLELSSVEVEKIRALPPGEVATCEQCGRILVPV